MFTYKFKITMLLILLIISAGFYNYKNGNCTNLKSCALIMKDNLMKRTRLIFTKIKTIFSKEKVN